MNNPDIVKMTKYTLETGFTNLTQLSNEQILKSIKKEQNGTNSNNQNELIILE
jgi:hypothetical protein